MKWLFLFVAGLFEVFWAFQLKNSHGFSKLTPSILTVVGMIVSFYFLSLALKHLPLGTSYAIWTGIGTVGTAIVGMAILNEPISISRIAGIGFIVVGIVGLKLLSTN